MNKTKRISADESKGYFQCQHKEAIKVLLTLAEVGGCAEHRQFGEWLSKKATRKYIPALATLLEFVFEDGMAGGYLQGPQFNTKQEEEGSFSITWTGTWTEERWVEVRFLPEWMATDYPNTPDGPEFAAEVTWDTGTGKKSKYLSWLY